MSSFAPPLRSCSLSPCRASNHQKSSEDRDDLSRSQPSEASTAWLPHSPRTLLIKNLHLQPATRINTTPSPSPSPTWRTMEDLSILSCLQKNSGGAVLRSLPLLATRRPGSDALEECALHFNQKQNLSIHPSSRDSHAVNAVKLRPI